MKTIHIQMDNKDYSKMLKSKTEFRAGSWREWLLMMVAITKESSA